MSHDCGCGDCSDCDAHDAVRAAKWARYEADLSRERARDDVEDARKRREDARQDDLE